MADEDIQLRESGPESKELKVLVRKLKRIIAKLDEDNKTLKQRLDDAAIP